MQSALSVEHNPVVRYLVERHAPVHEALLVSPKAWRLDLSACRSLARYGGSHCQ